MGMRMAEFELPNHSKSEIVAAGKMLRGNIILPVNEDALEAFRIAHNWRSSYALVMHRVRHELRGKVVRQGGHGLTAARLKRMTSIRRKLSKGNISLYQIQDIAGARAILPTMKDVERVTRYYLDGDTPHAVIRAYDYIDAPKADGYRSRHIVLKFNGQGEDAAYNRQFVEIQLRTEKQHAWATAVEAVGLVRNENLKAGDGSAKWLRFFALMSSEIAEREYYDISSSLRGNQKERREELRELNAALNAVNELQGYNQALAYTDRIDASTGRYFLINFHKASRKVTVSPHNRFREGGAEYNRQDRDLSETNAVLVEVDRVGDLKAAYPNYFLDVKTFVQECLLSIDPDTPNKLTAKKDATGIDDLSWLSTWRLPRR